MSSSSPLLEVSHLSTSWDGRPVLRDVSLTVDRGELFALLGPNGSGKTTLLRSLAGLDSPGTGTIVLDGVDVSRSPVHRRGIGLMFQEPALFPHRTVYENIAYAPLLRREPRNRVMAEVDGLVALLRLRGFEDRRPDQLSGGERQRVALARTLAARPKLVLFDEPFASIDVELKADLRAEFRRVLRSVGIAAIHVTHDREEGLFLGDRVGLLFEGQLERVGTPASVFGAPGSPRAARFLGYNVLAGTSGLEAVDPSDLSLGPLDTPGPRATVVTAGSVGREQLVVVRTESGERAELREPFSAGEHRPGDRGTLRWSRSIPLESG